VWRLPTRPYRGAHVAPFPIGLPLRAIAAGCPPGGVVLDPFSGAATTGLAALQLGRAYIGIDLNAAFHNEALARLRPYLSDQHREDSGDGGTLRARAARSGAVGGEAAHRAGHVRSSVPVRGGLASAPPPTGGP
jgi:hypothetical protein